MWLIFILILLVLILAWIFIAPLQIQIDTRIPEVYVRWVSLGKAKLVFDEDKWWLKISVFFISKKWELEKLLHNPRKKVKKVKLKPGTKKSKFLRRLFKIIKSSRITRWQIAIDTGDNVKNAWLYHLNFYPAFCHLHINFFDENYLFLEIRNAPWKMVYALMK